MHLAGSFLGPLRRRTTALLLWARRWLEKCKVREGTACVTDASGLGALSGPWLGGAPGSRILHTQTHSSTVYSIISYLEGEPDYEQIERKNCTISHNIQLLPRTGTRVRHDTEHHEGNSLRRPDGTERSRRASSLALTRSRCFGNPAPGHSQRSFIPRTSPDVEHRDSAHFQLLASPLFVDNRFSLSLL